MKKTFIISALVLAAAYAGAQTPKPAEVKFLDQTARATVSNLKIERSHSYLFIGGELSLAGQPKGTNTELWLEPVLTSGDSVRALPAIAVAGRNRYIHAQRHALTRTPDLTVVPRKGADQIVAYSAQIPYSAWMDGSTLSLNITEKGCCSADQSTRNLPVASVSFIPEVFHPVFNWITPADEGVKNRELRGQAFIDFPVGKSEIYPDYRSNSLELAKIRATIDSVKNDADVTIRSIAIHGFASPEGSYAMNEKLAKGRTEALKAYVDGLYRFAPGTISTAWTAEDWAGLRKWLEASSLDDAYAIIAIIDSPLAPDARELKIQRQFPQTYAMLKENVYPSLRHSDYRVEYTVRAFTTADDIIRVAQTRPQHLSLAEFFLGASSLPVGSENYNDLFETAARMYPESEIASLNAANAAMQQGALDTAARYLANAGDSPEAIYARGNLEALRGDYVGARTLFQQAAKLKVADAPAAIAQLDELEND